jgi:hypothetical protein
MSNFFDNIMNDLSGMEEQILGPNYKYYKFIKTPKEIGMSDKGSLDTIGSNINGLIAYTELLVSGGGAASATGKPLGNKYFLQTGAQCTDKKTGNQVNRFIYVNNVPDGEIPFISSGMGVNFTEFEGLLPGTMSNIAQLNPLGVFQAFMLGNSPECQDIKMETIDVNNNVSQETQHVLTSDIKNMNPCWFPNKINPVTNTPCRETFENRKQQPNNVTELEDDNIDYVKNLINVIYISLLIILFLSIANKCLKK